jgi:hypothetical protein
VTFYIDSSIQIAVREALAGVRDDVLYAGGPDAPAEDAKDEDWLPVAGSKGWIVLMRDTRIRTHEVRRKAHLDAGVVSFCLTNSGNTTRWGVLQLLVARWERIEQAVAQANSSRFFTVTQQGVRDVTDEPWHRPRRQRQGGET